MQNWPSNFHFFSFQSSNFQFCQFSFLTFNFCQCRILLNPSYGLLLMSLKRHHFPFFIFFIILKLKEKKIVKPFRHVADAPRRPKPSSVSEPTPLPIWTFPPLLGAPYLPAVSAFSPSTLTPEKIPWSRLVHALLNAPQTFLSFESQSNHSFVGGPHGGRQL